MDNNLLEFELFASEKKMSSLKGAWAFWDFLRAVKYKYWSSLPLAENPVYSYNFRQGGMRKKGGTVLSPGHSLTPGVQDLQTWTPTQEDLGMCPLRIGFRRNSRWLKPGPQKPQPWGWHSAQPRTYSGNFSTQPF
jgi:hypothetical protein